MIKCKNKRCDNKVNKKGNRCYSCAQKKRLQKSKNHPNYKDGRSLIQYYCIDCENKGILTKIGWQTWWEGNKRCNSCNKKLYFSIPKNTNNYKDGKSLIKRYCKNKICSKKISRGSKSCFCKSCSKKEWFKNPKNNPMYGKKHTKKTKRKISLSHGGNGNPYDYSKYGSKFDSSLKEKIRLRDQYRCQLCDYLEVENGKRLSVHHIDYDKKNNNINNLISLCNSCHAKTNIKNRKYYIMLLKNKITNKFLRKTKSSI